MTHPCFHFNHEPFPECFVVQDGWTEDGRRNMITIPNKLSRECQQWGEYGIAAREGWDCSGCRWRPKHDEVP